MQRVPVYSLAYVVLAHIVLASGFFCGVVLLPVLVVSNRFRQTFFAYFYQLCLKVWGENYALPRRCVLTRLDAMESHDSSLKSRGAVRLLEVGAAYGPNLQFVRRPVEYWKVEPNPAFDAMFQKNLSSNPKVKMQRSIRGHGEDMHNLPDGLFDAVLLTYVLCSAKDGRKLLSECRRVLRKGGLLLSCEHVGHPTGTLARFIQDMCAPLATYMAGGCHMNRDSADVIKSAGFAQVDLDEVVVKVPFLYSRHIFGVATA